MPSQQTSYFSCVYQYIASLKEDLAQLGSNVLWNFHIDDNSTYEIMEQRLKLMSIGRIFFHQ